jgi:hypothetical protein
VPYQGGRVWSLYLFRKPEKVSGIAALWNLSESKAERSRLSNTTDNVIWRARKAREVLSCQWPIEEIQPLVRLWEVAVELAILSFNTR